jgi:hypothetical protein
MPLSIKVHITICIFNTKKSLFPTYDVSQVVQGRYKQFIIYLLFYDAMTDHINVNDKCSQDFNFIITNYGKHFYCICYFL